jgi:uncharacterized protein YabN with tetrapyrrole methylase and pyrophosphatase domain
MVAPVIPEISKEEISRKPYIVAEKFKEAIRETVDTWMEAFSERKHLLSYHEVIQCFEGLVSELQTERHKARKARYERQREETTE